MHPALPLARPHHSHSADSGADIAELRESIHRATAGRAGRDELAQRQKFNEGVLVCESSISRWTALVGL